MKNIVSMRVPVLLAAFSVCFGATASASTILYGLGSAGQLYQITVTTGGAFSDVNQGTITGATALTDIAEYNGQLYGISDTNLYSISGTTATNIGTFGTGINAMVALTFGSNGILYGVESGTSTDYYEISTSTGHATAEAATGIGAGINGAGDLEVVGTNLYVTTGGTSGNSSLGEINLLTGAFTNRGLVNTGGTDYNDVFGLSIANGDLYAFTSGGQVLSFGTTSPTTGNVTVVTQTMDLDVYGTTDNATAPEPATLGVMGLGLLGIGSLRYRRRKS